MKFSVYVPDDLWEDATQVVPDMSRSQLVQEGLRRLVAGARSVAPPPAAVKRFDTIRNQFLQEAGALFRQGYNSGLGLAERLSWPALDAFHQEHPKSFADRLEAARRIQETAGDTRLTRPVATETLDRWTEAGMCRALEDLWTAVADEKPIWSPATAGGSSSRRSVRKEVSNRPDTAHDAVNDKK